MHTYKVFFTDGSFGFYTTSARGESDTLEEINDLDYIFVKRQEDNNPVELCAFTRMVIGVESAD